MKQEIELDANHDLYIYGTLCMECRHVLGARRCAAYPDGIPREILLEEYDHRKPFPGDNGIQFEQRKKPA
jgi:hypothetical protein